MLKAHLAETKQQIVLLDKVFASIGEKAAGRLVISGFKVNEVYVVNPPVPTGAQVEVEIVGGHERSVNELISCQT